MKSALKRAEEDDYHILPITSKFTIHLEPSNLYQGLSDSKKRLIQTYWDKEQKRREGKLHEGAILSAISYDQKSLTGQFVPYKYLFAQLCDPSLKKDLNIVPVSMSGITFIEDRLIVAKRASWVSLFSDCYELAPSGGVHPPLKDCENIDVKFQLAEELAEETGIMRSQIKSMKYFTLVHDKKENLVELCAEIHLKPGSLILSTSSEYTQIMVISEEEISDFAEVHKENFVPLSLTLLSLKGLFKPLGTR